MDEFNISQKLKLKPIKLRDLVFKNKVKATINYIKTERINIKSRNKLYNFKMKNPFLNTLNTTYLSKHNKTIENLKYKSPNKKSNLQGLTKITIKKKESKKREINSKVLNEGYINYLKIKTSKMYKRMKRLLFEEKIKKLSLPKYNKIIKFENSRTYKNKITNYNLTENDQFYQINTNYKYKKHLHDNLLFQKEKIKARKRFNTILQYNFKKLDSCERKFTNAIDKTMKLLSEYQHTLGILKTNDNTKEKI